MKKEMKTFLKIGSIILLVFIAIVIFGRSPSDLNEGNDKEFDKFMSNIEHVVEKADEIGMNEIICRVDDFTIPILQAKFDATGLDIKANQEGVDLLNTSPKCIVLCAEQFDYYDQYEDWMITDSLRELCESIGIVLPE